MTFEEITAFAKENEVPKMIGDEDKAVLLLFIGEIERYQKREITEKELSLTHQRLKEMHYRLERGKEITRKNQAILVALGGLLKEMQESNCPLCRAVLERLDGKGITP